MPLIQEPSPSGLIEPEITGGIQKWANFSML
jgi:hypothetical protein